MSQRTLAGIVAVPLLVALWVLALVLPTPVVTNRPGLTVDVLAAPDDRETIQVQGAKTYRDDGQLRLTTVYVTQPGARVNLFEAMAAWVDPRDAVLPYDAVYAPEESRQDSEAESAAQMVSSQDTAIAAALTELDYDVTEDVEVLAVTADTPADGKLAAEDQLLEIDGEEIETPQDVVDAVTAAGSGDPVEFVVRRSGERRTVEVTPTEVDGKPRIGILPGVGYEFPIDVSIEIPDSIGGPSAGLMFSLGILDTLTPDSLTGGETIAGTGTITAEGEVGPIGGIQQKIVAAEGDGAELFLVPPGNCADALETDVDDIRLVRADTLSDARDALAAWVADPDADLPSCEDAT
ncbi:PDZ domain-containing protein [uncultured Nocardioides sp.]|uniref:YlbL family protein n=1 Tax=uncultured Nocardioides sp. TaxID=198441 RepID=UPI0026086580|nr:PDZ domain-containing protein [uncultured Nocardioides sp.]